MNQNVVNPILDNPEILKTALRAIYEASWRLKTILKELPDSPNEINEDGDENRMPEIMKDHGDICLKVIWNAIEMLAQSERRGCALGAAMALIIDWGTIREVLDCAAKRFGVEAPEPRLLDTGPVRALADQSDGKPAVTRALLFGAEQVALQHRGLWDLLEARQQARGIY